MIKLVELQEYPKWLKEALVDMYFQSKIDEDMFIVKLLEDKYPPNVERIKHISVKEIIKSNGYCRAKNNPLKIYLKSEDIFDYIIVCHLYEVDETRPWTKIEMGEYSQIIYLDSFECVDVVNNYYEINDKKNKV